MKNISLAGFNKRFVNVKSTKSLINAELSANAVYFKEAIMTL